MRHLYHSRIHDTIFARFIKSDIIFDHVESILIKYRVHIVISGHLVESMMGSIQRLKARPVPNCNRDFIAKIVNEGQVSC